MCSQNFKAKFEVLPKLWELYGARSSLLPDAVADLETKEARKARKEEMLAANLSYEEEEGLLYDAGIAD